MQSAANLSKVCGLVIRCLCRVWRKHQTRLDSALDD